MAEQFYRLADVKRRYAVSTSWIYERIPLGMFPAPVKLGAAARWPESSLAKFDETLKSGAAVDIGTGRRKSAKAAAQFAATPPTRLVGPRSPGRPRKPTKAETEGST